jgi:hypothetical protein
MSPNGTFRHIVDIISLVVYACSMIDVIHVIMYCMTLCCAHVSGAFVARLISNRQCDIHNGICAYKYSANSSRAIKRNIFFALCRSAWYVLQLHSHNISEVLLHQPIYELPGYTIICMCMWYKVTITYR